MNRFRWWHRLKGHTIITVMPDFSDIVRCAQVRDRCSCGDEWIFFAIGMYENYYPGGEVRT